MSFVIPSAGAAAPLVPSAFAQSVLATLQQTGAVPVDATLWDAVAVLRRPNGEIYTHFSEKGDHWLQRAGRFHESVTEGLTLEDIPLGLQAFFRETFFSELVATARFDLYFQTMADVIAAEFVEPFDSTQCKPDSRMHALEGVDRPGVPETAPTVPAGQKSHHRASPYEVPREVSDTIPAPAPWASNEASIAAEPQYDKLMASITKLLVTYNVLEERASIEDIIDALHDASKNLENSILFERFRRPGIGWAEIADQFHRTISRGLSFEDIPAAIHKFFSNLYFIRESDPARDSDEVKFERYFSLLAAVVAEENKKIVPPDSEQESGPRSSGIWLKEGGNDQEEAPATLRSPVLLTVSSEPEPFQAGPVDSEQKSHPRSSGIWPKEGEEDPDEAPATLRSPVDISV